MPLSLIREICYKQHHIKMFFGHAFVLIGDTQSKAFQFFSKNI